MYTKKGFKNAIDNGDNDKVKDYLAHLSKSPKTLKKFLNLKHNDYSMVYRAWRGGHTEILDALLTAGAPGGIDITHTIAYQENIEMLSVIFKHDAYIQSALEDILKKDDYDWYPSHEDAALFLVRNAAQYIDLDAALRCALSCNRYNIAKKLVLTGANINTVANNKTHLVHLVMEHQDLAFFPVLIEKNADFNAQNHVGDTPLHIALRKDNMGLVHLLIAHGARTDILNDRGHTATALAKTKKIPLFENAAPVKAPSPPPETSGETWQPLNAWEIARVAPQPALNQTIIEIFNFKTSERRPILEDTRTGTKTPGISEIFSKISTIAVEEARAEHKKYGGQEKPYTAAVFIGKKTG